MRVLKDMRLEELCAVILTESVKLQGLIEGKKNIELGETLTNIDKALRKAKWRLLDVT